tara:strand:+ start:3667 stop:4008 length:342 start_codon:yes stop_codon:yes gene_type:complete
MDHQDWGTNIINIQNKEPSKPVQKIVLSESHSHFVKLNNADGEDGFHQETISYSLRMEIQKARNAKKLSQKQLAKNLNISATIIHEYESGKSIPNPSMLVKLSKELGVKLKKH